MTEAPVDSSRHCFASLTGARGPARGSAAWLSLRLLPLHCSRWLPHRTPRAVEPRIVFDLTYYLHSPKIVPPIREIAVLGEWDRLPRFAVSTFRDHNQFAKVHGSIMLPHTKVTPARSASGCACRPNA
jgi:hypothetical protein